MTSQLLPEPPRRSELPEPEISFADVASKRGKGFRRNALVQAWLDEDAEDRPLMALAIWIALNDGPKVQADLMANPDALWFIANSLAGHLKYALESRPKESEGAR